MDATTKKTEQCGQHGDDKVLAVSQGSNVILVPDGFQPLETIRFWIGAYTDPANGPNFAGHGMLVKMMREYEYLRLHRQVVSEAKIRRLIRAVDALGEWWLTASELKAARDDLRAQLDAVKEAGNAAPEGGEIVEQHPIETGSAVAEPGASAQAYAVSSEERKILDGLYQLLYVGEQARSASTVLTCLENIKRFSDLLHAIELQFFMVPGDPSDEPEDQGIEPDDVCLLNCWGSSEDEYLKQFGAALPFVAARLANHHLEVPDDISPNLPALDSPKDGDVETMWLHQAQYRVRSARNAGHHVLTDYHLTKDQAIAQFVRRVAQLGQAANAGLKPEGLTGIDLLNWDLGGDHIGSAPAEELSMEQLMAKYRILVSPEYEGQWYADLYSDQPDPVFRAEGDGPGEAVRAVVALFEASYGSDHGE